MYRFAPSAFAGLLFLAMAAKNALVKAEGSMPFGAGSISYSSFWGDTRVTTFSTVGFDGGRDVDELMVNAKRFLADPDTVSSPGLREGYKIWHLPTESGAELWAGCTPRDGDGERNFFGFDPHFVGKSRLAITIEEKFEDKPNKNECIFRGRARPVETGRYFRPPETDDFMEKIMWISMNHCQFNFFCPSYQLFGCDIELSGFTIMLQVAAFARDVRVFATPEEYGKYNAGEIEKGHIGMSDQSFGCFPDVGPKKEHSDDELCLSMITGIVKETERKVNDKTGQAFYWALVETHAGCQFDVVIHPKLLETNGGSSPPKVGGIIQGIFYMSGRLLPGELEKAWNLDEGTDE